MPEYYHPTIVAGTCRHICESGEPCGVPFSGPRNQKYCAEHQAIEKTKKHNQFFRRARAVNRIARKVQKREVPA